MARFSICCIFREQPIKFKTTTARFLSQFSNKDQKKRLSQLCMNNAQSLKAALTYCNDNNIGGFRINSGILPLKTHPEVGYDINELPGADKIIHLFKNCGRFSQRKNIRTSFHPDQFIVLSSPHPDVVKRSIADLEYQAQVAEWVNADVINIHAGGVYGDKVSAISRLKKTIETLSIPVRERLTVENDDKSYTVEDLLPVCRDMDIPLVYDVHHHRCNRDELSVSEATSLCKETWNREPLFHISSPKYGWGSPDVRKHHDYIDLDDLPASWPSMDITIDVEAKAKELAVLKLMKEVSENL